MMESFRSNRFVGNLRPVNGRPKEPPIWETVFKIGSNPKYPTYVTLYIRRPTFEFPKRSIFLQVNNGAGSAFARLDSPDSIDFLCELFQEAKSQAQKAWESLASQELTIQTGLAAWAVAQGMQVDDLSYAQKEVLQSLTSKLSPTFTAPNVQTEPKPTVQTTESSQSTEVTSSVTAPNVVNPDGSPVQS